MKIQVDKEKLLCPHCGSAYLHQESVEVVFRDREDAPGTSASSSRAGVHVSRVADTHGRRDAIIIQFSCEMCEEKDIRRELVILQHKGETLMEWA